MKKLQGWNSTRIANYLVAIILVLVPFHAFLTVWGSQLFGHYTALRLWDETVLLLLAGIAVYWLVRNHVQRKELFSSVLFRLIVAYVVLTFALGFIAFSKHDVSAKALGYALIVNLRYLAFFVVVGLLAQRSDWLRQHWLKLLLVPAAIVCVFAVLQYTVLPHDFLAHFGYNAHVNIAPYETINHNSHYIRVISTLRGSNPLGAYLVIISSALASLYFASKSRRRKQLSFGVFAVLALFFSGSRSGWIGAFVAVFSVLFLQLKSKRAKLVSVSVAGGMVVVLLGAFLALHTNAAVENALLHTQTGSKIKVSSNAAHESALRSGLRDIVRQPLGRGPGTAGPASVYNTGYPARIAENYYIQIAQEVGWPGLVLLLSIMGIVAYELYRARQSPLALALLASFAGLFIVNMFSHAWVDDTLSYTWWGLAAIACVPPPEHKLAKKK